jgi:hypothetical protein
MGLVGQAGGEALGVVVWAKAKLALNDSAPTLKSALANKVRFIGVSRTFYSSDTLGFCTSGTPLSIHVNPNSQAKDDPTTRRSM